MNGTPINFNNSLHSDVWTEVTFTNLLLNLSISVVLPKE